MGLFAARFFSWLQAAPFYTELHAQAVTLLPQGNNATWLDVGCGPGLVTRLAARRGYRATGMDHDARMIEQARRLAKNERSCQFFMGDVQGMERRGDSDVVSAASLLFVVDDARAALQQLWQCVRPGGTLLVIETTERMTPANARAIAHLLPRERRWALRLWARARQGRAISSEIFASLPATSRVCTPLLHGMVAAWTFGKAGA